MAIAQMQVSQPIDGGLTLRGNQGKSEHDQHLSFRFDVSSPSGDTRAAIVHLWRDPPKPFSQALVHFDDKFITFEIIISSSGFDRLIELIGVNGSYIMQGMNFEAEYVAPKDSPPQGKRPITHDLIEWTITQHLKPDF